MEPPYVVKPVERGSSFGVVIVKEGQSHPPQIISIAAIGNTATPSWSSAIVDGRELTCAVMGDTALGVTEIVPVGHAFYDYDSKYVAGGSKHVSPAKISPNIYQKVQTLALGPIRLSAAGVFRGRTSATTTAIRRTANSSGSRSTPSPA